MASGAYRRRRRTRRAGARSGRGLVRDVDPPRRAAATTGLSGRLAFKTGTSYGYRDAWAIGYDGKTVIGVWVGRPDGVPVPGISGIKAAAPILFEAFDRVGPTRALSRARRRA